MSAPPAQAPAPALGPGPSRFVEPVSPVRALASTSTPDTASPPPSAKPLGTAADALDEDDLTVESFSPCCRRASQHPGDGDQPVPSSNASRDRDRDAATKRLHPSSTSAPSLQPRTPADSSSLAKLEEAAANGVIIDTWHSVQVQHDKTTRSAPAPLRGPARGKSITITSTRQVLPPGNGIRTERWSLGGPAELFAGTKSTWDIVLGQGSPPPPPPPPQPASAANIPSLRTVSLSLAERDSRGRRASCPDQQHDVFLTEDCRSRVHGRGTCRDSEPVLSDQLVRHVFPERESCPECSCSRDASVQVSGPPPLQLHVLPPHRCRCSCGGRGPGPCAWFAQLVFCQAGLALIILALALIGAAAFHATEGPHEEDQFRELTKQQGELVVQLALELRQVVPEDTSWHATIARSVERHEAMVLRAAAAGYGEGGAGEGGARIWTFPGGLLFAASLLTTLGFGAPVPRTPLGRMAAVLLALVGIPLNVILALQLGRLLCTRLPRALPLLTPRPRAPRPGQGQGPSKPRSPRTGCLPGLPAGARDAIGAGLGRAALWLPMLLPVLSLLLYYLIGMVVFGRVLALPASEWLLFPLSLTAAGGVAQVPGWVRVLYAAYLEGGILLAAVAVALLQAPATTATTDLAMKLGILDLSDYYGA